MIKRPRCSDNLKDNLNRIEGDLTREEKEGLFMTPKRREYLQDLLTFEIMRRLEELKIEPSDNFKIEHNNAILRTINREMI